MNETVVTGLGCITALGSNVREFWAGLAAGQTAIAPIRGFRPEFLRNQSAAEIPLNPQMTEYARVERIHSRLTLFAALAIAEAISESGLTPQDLRNRKVGLILGVSLGMSLVKGGLNSVSENANPAEKTADDLSDVAGDLAGRFGVRGEGFTVSTACAAGANAIGIARDMILLDGYDTVICGGADTVDRMKYLGHSALNTLSPTRIQPFAPTRDGTILGEGAGILVLESSQNLAGREPLAVCAGAGFSCDAHHITAPDPRGEGAIQAMKDALRDADLGPAEIDHINLHGSGTPQNDAVEAHAIGEVFGSAAGSIPATSIKSAIGHAMGAAGACEAVATVLSVQQQTIPPTPNTQTKDPALPLRLVCGCPMQWEIEHALSNSFGFGGCNGALIFSKWRQG